MKRTMVQIPLSKEKQFSLDVPEPGVIRQFMMAYREKAISLLTAGNGTPQKTIEEIPMILVEIDPDAPVRKRQFVVLAQGQIVESQANLVYVGSVVSQASNNALFHLFEEMAPTT